MTRAARIAASVLALAACREAGEGASARGPIPSSSSVDVVPIAPTMTAPPTPSRSPAEVCRAIATRGAVTRDDGRAIARNTSLDDAPWLTLGEGAALVIKHVRTTREIALDGPARIKPCHDGGESLLVARGTLRSTGRAGARPGAEVFIATPQGVVSYADARLRLEATPASVALSVQAGSAWLDLLGEDSATTVTAGADLRREGPAPDVKNLLQACKRAATAAREAGQAVLDESARGQALGVRAGLHFRTRRGARKACGIAATALGLLPASPEHEALGGELDAAISLWRGQPGDDKSSNNANFR